MHLLDMSMRISSILHFYCMHEIQILSSGRFEVKEYEMNDSFILECS